MGALLDDCVQSDVDFCAAHEYSERNFATLMALREHNQQQVHQLKDSIRQERRDAARIAADAEAARQESTAYTAQANSDPPPPPPAPPAQAPPATPFGTPYRRPTHEHAGVRIGEASNPGPPKFTESERKTAATPHNGPATPTSTRQGTRTSVPTPPTRLRKTTEDQTAARTSLEYNLGMIGWVLLATAPDKVQIWTCPAQNCSFTTAVEDGHEEPCENKSQREITLVKAHNHSHAAHGKLFTQPIGGGQWRTLPAEVQNSLITRCIATWNKNLTRLRQNIEVKRFSFQPKDKQSPRVWMHGLFATADIERGQKFTGSYTGEAISSSQMITRTEHSDKLMKINKHVVDGTDPRMASYLSMANTCPPGGSPNTMAWAIDDSREVNFVTTRAISKGEQILWQYHDIFDAPDDLVDFADPTSCDLEMEEWQSPSATAVANDSNGPTCPAGHSTGRSRADDAGYQCSRCLEFTLEGAALWSCDHYTCDFDICCLCCEAWLLRTKAIEDEGDQTDHTHACLDERSLCSTARGDKYSPSSQTAIIQSMRATATGAQLEELKDIELDMNVRSAKAAIQRPRQDYLKEQIALMLNPEDPVEPIAPPARNTPPTTPPRPPRAGESPIYSPLAGESPIYSPVHSDAAQELEQKETPQSRIEARYPPTRSGICPFTLQDWPRPRHEEMAKPIGQPTQKQQGCTCNCHHPGPRHDCFSFAEGGAPDIMTAQITSVRNRIRADTDRRYAMDCADCCKATRYDEDFFRVSPDSLTMDLSPTSPGSEIRMTKMAIRIVSAQRPPSLCNAQRSSSSTSYQGRPPDPYEHWIEGWNIQQTPFNLSRYQSPRIYFPHRLYVTQSQAIKAWLTERKGLHGKGHEGILGLQSDMDQQGPSPSIRGSRRIQATKFMDRFPHSISLQLTGMASLGPGLLRVKAATEEEDSATAILARRTNLLKEINDEELETDTPGPQTLTVRNEHTLAGRLETPTLNDITVRNAVCWELELTSLGNVHHGTEKKECFGEGPQSNKIVDITLDYMFGWHLEQQSFESRSEGEFGNEAARLILHFGCPISVDTSVEERQLFRDMAHTQFFRNSARWRKYLETGEQHKAQSEFEHFQKRALQHMLYPHATHSLTKLQAAKQYCREVTLLEDHSKDHLLTSDTRIMIKERPFPTRTADFAVALTAGRHARGAAHWSGDTEFSTMVQRRDDAHRRWQYSLQVPKARNPRLKLRRKRTPEQEASEQKSKHGKPETPPTAKPIETGAKKEINHEPDTAGPPSRILLLDASIKEDAEIQRKLEAGEYDPPWEHKSPVQATFTIELSIANRQADANKVRRSRNPPRTLDMCPLCEVYNECITATQTVCTKGVAEAVRPRQPRTVIKRELTVALPCGCKMHYDCVLHALRGHEAYIYAEEHRYFDCPKCRCEFTQEEQWYMDRALSIYMPAEYVCNIWDSSEGIRREMARHNSIPYCDTPAGTRRSPASPSWWAESSEPPEIFREALHPSSSNWKLRWGASIPLNEYANLSWELWPRGPVRNVFIKDDEHVGAIISVNPETAALMRKEQEASEGLDCRLCTRAAEMQDLWNQHRSPEHHAYIIHCMDCGRLILKLQDGDSGTHHPPPHCTTYYIRRGDGLPEHRNHVGIRINDRETCQPLPRADPTSLQAQIDEGGNPFGNIPKDVELCFESGRMLHKREDQFHLKPGEKTVSPRGKAPLRAVKVGSNFSSRRGIISLSSLKLQIMDLLLPEDSSTNMTTERQHYRKVVPDPGPAPEDTEAFRNAVKFRAVEEAGRRIYMTIAGHRTPKHRHVEDHENEGNSVPRDTDPQNFGNRQSRIDASYNNLEAEFNRTTSY